MKRRLVECLWSPRAREWLFAFALAVTTFFAYQPAWTGQPVWDDAAHLTAPELRSLEGLRRIWADPGATQQYYPLVCTVFWVEHHLWGDATLGYHLVNILLHVASALLFLQILRKLKVPGAHLAAAIFALHPVHVESVAWMSELKNTLSGVFYLSAGLVYLRFDQTRKPGPYFLALAFFALGLMAKTVIATLPAALLVIFWWKRSRLRWREDVWPLVPFFLAGIAAGVATAAFEHNVVGARGRLYDFSLLERVLVAGRAFWFYLAKLCWPANLAFTYRRWNVSQAVWWQYLYPAAALMLLAAAWSWRRRSRGVLAALLLFGGTLFPALGFFNVYPFRYSFVADHFQYLASLGVIALAAAGAALTFKRWRLGDRSVAYVSCLALLLALAGLSWRQCGMYADMETLWRSTIAHEPESEMPHYNLAILLAQRGELEEAIAHYEKVLDIAPDHFGAHNNLGLVLLQKGRAAEAIPHLERALSLDPAHAGAALTLGAALAQNGQLPQAIALYRRVLEHDPDNPQVLCNLGNLLLQQGQTAEAVSHLQRALQLHPDNVLINNSLAWVLATSGEGQFRDGSKAVAFAEKANTLSGARNASVLRTLGAAYAEAGRFPEAVRSAQRALTVAIALNNRAEAAALRQELARYQAGSAFHARAATNVPARWEKLPRREDERPREP
jgi:protein O-mannosyl-transferase